MAVSAIAPAERPSAGAGTRLRAHPWLAAATGGALLAAAMPPVHLLPGLLAFAALLHLLHGEASPRRALLLGWLLGFAFCTTGLYWIGIAFFIDAGRYGLLAVPAVLGLCALLGFTVGLAAWATALMRWRSLEARALAFAVAWTLGELTRAGTIIQFPWNPVALAWSITDTTLQGVAWAGTYGLSLLTVAAMGLLARWLEPGPRRWVSALPAVTLVAVLALGGAWRLAGAERLGQTNTTLRLVQANIPQEQKWDRDKRVGWFRRHLELSARPGDQAPQVVVWPESAVPFQLELEPVAREHIASLLPPGGYAVVGGDRFVRDGEQVIATNSLFVLGTDARILTRYDKVDLVPFGEFTPFRAIMGQLGLGKLVESSVDFTPGPARVTISPEGLPPFSPLICYEAVFPNEAAPLSPRPAWLLNITNDAWFGRSSGPYQHLAQARMRAIEEGLPLVRAANTGISVVTDPYGRVLARLGLGKMGIIDARLPEALPEASIARRLAPWLLPGLIAMVLLTSAMVEISVRRAA